MDNSIEDAVIQNLIDAGCDRQTVRMFLNSMKGGDIKDELCILEKHRSYLLDTLHLCQKRIDCLDYLICQIKRKNRSMKGE